VLVKKSNPTWRIGTGMRQGLNTGEITRNPGPGTYENYSGLLKNGVSIKSRHEVIDKNVKYVPGPGNYEYKSSISNTSYSIGRDHRFKSGKESFSGTSPGPGN